MKTMARITNSVDLTALKQKFPVLWANHKEHFYLFFNKDCSMNTLGFFAYDTLKKEHKQRINHQTERMSGYIWSHT